MAAAEVLNAPAIPTLGNDVSGYLPKLRSNQGHYVASSSTGWMRPTPSDTPIDEMRKRFRDEGYVWIKNVIPREVVYDMREQWAPHCILDNHRES